MDSEENNSEFSHWYSVDSFLNNISTRNKEPLDDKMKVNITKYLTNQNLSDTHISTCSCGCKNTTSFWKTIPYGFVRIDILTYLLEQKFIDLEKEKDRSNMFIAFSGLLHNSGIQNTKGQDINVHELTMFFFEILGPYCSNYKEKSLIHAAFYGYDYERKKIYVNILLNLGCQITFIELDKDFLKHFKVEIVDKCLGQSPLYLAMQGHEEILDRLLLLEEAKTNVNTYDNYYNDGRRTVLPMILGQLLNDAKVKKPEFLQETANCFRILIEKGNYDINLLAHYDDGTCHNITDYLNYYGYNYPNSPIMEVFSNLILPEPLDPDCKNYIVRERLYVTPFTTVLEKYKYMKDPTKYHIVIAELEEVLRSGVRYERDITDSCWLSIPEIEAFSRRAEVIQAQRDRIREWNRNMVQLDDAAA
ncbi:MAG: hypothetical protein Barrevirus25_2 [Barrevirus sp.]|uniref:Ankyrin repeat protein n=1 Tax=Barrevirus sp. TaxID=2487763 RepID=A0A3G4ZV12_9VIRU|nr:MAG: hypothetical protein Barrevirus25_2 [Barrevirus sp.]